MAAGSGNGGHQGAFPVLSHQRGMRGAPQGQGTPTLKELERDDRRQ